MTTKQNNAAAVTEHAAHAAGTVERTTGLIEAALKSKLDPAHIKSREQGGGTVQYIEGWRAIDKMNEIFGHLNWKRETDYLKEVCRYENAKGNYVVGYEAKVVVTVPDERGELWIVREGTGYGSGIAKDLFSAIESAGKEAETDAMKRALMTLGYPLGLALYDKTRANVAPEEPVGPTEAQQQSHDKWVDAITKAATEADLLKLTNTDQYRNALAKLDGTELKAALMNTVTTSLEALAEKSKQFKEETAKIAGAA